MGILVKNMIDTGDEDCCCDGGWIAHWERYSGNKRGECAAAYCDEPAEHGGHVKKAGVEDDDPYIIPICISHNNMNDNYEVEDSTKFVTASPICCDES